MPDSTAMQRYTLPVDEEELADRIEDKFTVWLKRGWGGTRPAYFDD